MDTKQNNVTSVGIAVAIAVIVAIGLLFFGPRIFTPFTNGITATTTDSMATDTDQTTNSQDNTPAMPDSNATSTGAIEGLPANVTELMTKDEVVGTGATAVAGDTVTVQYVGMLTNGQVFDASSNHGTTGFTFQLGAGQVIKGWDEGVAGMKVGGKRQLVIPASLGYGAQATGPIPANSTLVFEVELTNVQPAAAQ
jgi:FKBP-type peptidyl-prolyl cis-trans isomerase